MKSFIRKAIITVSAVFALILFQGSLESKAAVVGQQLLQPEAGWTRYDDTDPRIVYDGNWRAYSNSYNTYNGVYHHNYKNGRILVGAVMKFEFYGSDLRILTWKAADNSGVNIKIDGVDYGNFDNYNRTYGGSYLFFEKLGLARGFHKVVLTTLDKSVFNSISSDNWFTFDGIDIGAGGELVSYNDDIDYGNRYVKVDGGMSNVSRGQEFELEVKYFDDEDMTSLFGQITYNKNLLKLEELTVRDGLKLLKAKKTPGLAIFSLTSLDKAPIGNGSVIKLKFKALASGQAAVGINNLRAGKDMCIRTIDNRRCLGKDIYVG